MRPAPIEPDEEIAGMVHHKITAPGSDGIGDIDALISGANPETGMRAYVSKWELEEDELLKLAGTGKVWITLFAARHPVISIEVREKAVDDDEPTA